MPLYEFRCANCNHQFVELVAWNERDKVVCPKCQSKEVKQLLAGFGLATSGGSSSGAGCGSSGFG